jgi:hypothetical protein
MMRPVVHRTRCSLAVIRDRSIIGWKFSVNLGFLGIDVTAVSLRVMTFCASNTCFVGTFNRHEVIRILR